MSRFKGANFSSSVVEPTLFDLWQTISGDWESVTWRLTALFTFLVLSSGSRLTDYKHQETNWQDNAHHHTTKPSRNNTPLMVLHSSRGQINKKKNYPEYIYISNCRKKVTRWSLIDMWWWNCVYSFPFTIHCQANFLFLSASVSPEISWNIGLWKETNASYWYMKTMALIFFPLLFGHLIWSGQKAFYSCSS